MNSQVYWKYTHCRKWHQSRIYFMMRASTAQSTTNPKEWTFFLQTFVQGTSCGTEKTQNKTKSFRKVHAVTSKMIPTYSMNQIHIQYGLFIKKNQMCCEYWIKDSRSQSAIHFQWIILLNLYTYKQCVTFSIQKNKN